MLLRVVSIAGIIHVHIGINRVILRGGRGGIIWVTSEKNNWTSLCTVGHHLVPVLKPRVASSNRFACGIVLQVDKEA